MDCTTPGLLVFHYFLEFAQIHANCVDASIQPSHSLCPLLHLPSIFPSISVFSKESVLRLRWPEYWSFSSSINLSNEYSRLISFRSDCWISLQSKGLSRIFSNTTFQKHQFFGAQLSLCKKRKMLLSSLLFSAIGKASSDNHFAFLNFFFLGMVLITASCTVL